MTAYIEHTGRIDCYVFVQFIRQFIILGSVLTLASVGAASTGCNLALAFAAPMHTERMDECCSHSTESEHNNDTNKTDECAPLNCSHCVCSHFTVDAYDRMVIASVETVTAILIPPTIGSPVSIPDVIDHPPLWDDNLCV